MMDALVALRTLSRHRGRAVVVATMSASFLWPRVSAVPALDFLHSEVMGKTSSVGLGLALALPAKRVIVLDGDGSLLMNLGTLVTIAGMAPPNLVHVVIGNDTYLTAGHQPLPGRSRVDFAGLARAAGYPSVHRFAETAVLARELGDVMRRPGPTFVYLEVAPAWTRARAGAGTLRVGLTRLRTALGRMSRGIRARALGQRLAGGDRLLASRIRALTRRGQAAGRPVSPGDGKARV